MKISLKFVEITLFVVIIIVSLVFFAPKYFSNKFEGVTINDRHESFRANLATSSDNNLIASYRNYKVGEITVGELWLTNLSNNEQKLLVKEGPIASSSMVNASGISNPPKKIFYIKSSVFSNDNKKLYFLDSLAYMVSGAIYSIDLNDGKLSFVCGSNYLDVVKEGKYKDYLITNQHRPHEDYDSGTTDYFYIVDPSDGEDVKNLGNSLDSLNN